MVFRESRVVDEVWAGVAPRALAGEALLIVLDLRARPTQPGTASAHPEIRPSRSSTSSTGRSTPPSATPTCDLGSTAFLGSPADFNKFIAEETEKWAGVIKFAGIKSV